MTQVPIEVVGSVTPDISGVPAKEKYPTLHVRMTLKGRLKGKTALATVFNPTVGFAPTAMLWLQFDDLEAEMEGVNLAHGWHAFSTNTFEILRPWTEFEWLQRFKTELATQEKCWHHNYDSVAKALYPSSQGFSPEKMARFLSTSTK